MPTRRNGFLHGNPVPGDDLRLPNSQRNIFAFAALLHRVALAVEQMTPFRGQRTDRQAER
jgi:hypothetical protein